MTHEVLSFVQSLGYAEVGFYGDNEPTIRQILKTIITARHALGLKTRIFTTKVKDSAGNSLAENAIQRIRQLACTLVEDVSQRTGLTFPCAHALWSWAGRHAAWCLNRFQVGRSMTSFEVCHGKSYGGKMARFGEPIYAYCKPRGKADAKWRVGLFLGKTESQDAWIVGDGADVMLTRSIRRVDRPWTSFLPYFNGLQTHSFVYQTNFGGRIVPTKRKIVPQKQDGRLLPKLSEVERRFADEEAQAVLAYSQSRQGRLEAQQELREALDELPVQAPPGASVIVSDIAEAPQAEQVLPSSTSMASQPMNAELLAQPSSPRTSLTRALEPGAGIPLEEEPAAKRMRPEEHVLRRIAMVERRLVEVTINHETYHHLDNVIDEDFMNAWESEDADEAGDDLQATMPLEKLWSDDPLSRSPAEPPPEVDRLADMVEVERLEKMGVIEKLSPEDQVLEQLTTRMVYDWRVKDWLDPKSGTTRRRWMRRARLVALEYANQRRDDVHSPASGSQVLRLLPTIYLMLTSVDGINREDIMLGSLDIKDAFLMADQEKPLQISTKVGKFKVKKNLPGQRLAARSWFEFISSYLETKDVQFCTENPCLGRRNGGLYILLHVDDMMFCGTKIEVEKLIAELKDKFNISCKEDGIDIHPGGYAEAMIEAFEKRYGAVKLQQVPCGDESQEIGTSIALPLDEAKLYRSLVGSGIYLSQERIEIGFIIKQLASGMANPCQGHLQAMRKLIGYLKNTLGHYSHLKAPSYGQGVHHHYDSKWVLETFTDADWSGDRKTRRSTSSAVHCVNGIVVHHTSRGQRVVSLSSAESELHGIVGGATDGISLKVYLAFLLDEEILHLCITDNSATKQLCNKRGTGRLRHVSGKLLWLQDEVSMKNLEVQQISTVLNIADIARSLWENFGSTP
eukprot:s650_g7.t1